MVKTPITWDTYPAPAGPEINGQKEAFMYIYVIISLCHDIIYIYLGKL